MSVLAADLARRLRARGWGHRGIWKPRPRPTRETGSDADSRVELAVFDPFAKRSPMVAVELDGTAYARAGGPDAGAAADRPTAPARLAGHPGRECRSLPGSRARGARIVAALEGLRASRTCRRPARASRKVSRRAQLAGPPGRSDDGRRKNRPDSGADAAELRHAQRVGVKPESGSLLRPSTESRPAPGARSRRATTRTQGWGETGSIDAHDRWLEENRPRTGVSADRAQDSVTQPRSVSEPGCHRSRGMAVEKGRRVSASVHALSSARQWDSETAGGGVSHRRFGEQPTAG